MSDLKHYIGSWKQHAVVLYKSKFAVHQQLIFGCFATPIAIGSVLHDTQRAPFHRTSICVISLCKYVTMGRAQWDEWTNELDFWNSSIYAMRTKTKNYRWGYLLDITRNNSKPAVRKKAMENHVDSWNSYIFQEVLAHIHPLFFNTLTLIPFAVNIWEK